MKKILVVGLLAMVLCTSCTMAVEDMPIPIELISVTQDLTDGVYSNTRIMVRASNIFDDEKTIRMYLTIFTEDEQKYFSEAPLITIPGKTIKDFVFILPGAKAKVIETRISYVQEIKL